MKSKEAFTNAVSARVRYARNLADYPFCGRLGEQGRMKVRDLVREAFFGANAAMERDYDFIDMDALSETDAAELVERHLISPEFAAGEKGRGLIVNKDRNLSIMINEEDHLRIQALAPRDGLSQAWERARAVEGLLAQRLRLAYSDRWGSLTACYTNIGTGMRASVMLHLPAMSATGAIKRLVNESARLGVTVRGIYGEGSTAQGDLYQLSNTFTLGVSEADIISRMQEFVARVDAQERELLERLYKAQGLKLADSVARAGATLKSARLMDTAEFERLYSLARTGAALKLLEIDPAVLDALFENCRPACVAHLPGTPATPDRRDAARADLCRKTLGN